MQQCAPPFKSAQDKNIGALPPFATPKGKISPCRAPEPLPILSASNFVPRNGFPVVKGLTKYFYDSRFPSHESARDAGLRVSSERNGRSFTRHTPRSGTINSVIRGARALKRKRTLSSIEKGQKEEKKQSVVISARIEKMACVCPTFLFLVLVEMREFMVIRLRPCTN